MSIKSQVKRRVPSWWKLAVAALLTGVLTMTVLSKRSTRIGTPATGPLLTIFLIDGLSQEVFERELAEGHLPNAAELIAEGTYVKDGVSSFPSMTAYGYFPFLTARDAARSGVLGLRWMDRKRSVGSFRHYVGRTYPRMNEDFAAEPPWLFERFPGVHSFSINSYANRGVMRDEKTGWAFSMAKYREHNAVVRALSNFGPTKALFPDWKRAENQSMDVVIDDLKHRPKIQWVTFTSTDARDHVWGLDETYAELLRHIDGLIGTYREESRRLGQESERVYALVSDHGVADAHRNVDLRVPLAAVGLRAWRGEATNLSRSELGTPLSELDDEDVVFAINGNMLNHVYLREGSRTGAEAWQTRPDAACVDAYVPRAGRAPVDIARVLLMSDGVELVLTRPDARGIRVMGRNGTGFITGDEHALTWRCEGRDPLNGEPCDPVTRTEREWLDATHAGPYPDALVRIHRLMTSPDIGELVVLSEPGVDLAADYEMIVGNYRGGHGGLRANQLRVPYILAGPGVPKGLRIPTGRSEDVGATLHALLGQPIPENAEGRSLFAVTPAHKPE